MPFDIGVMPASKSDYFQHAYDLVKKSWVQKTFVEVQPDGQFGFCAIGALDFVSKSYTLSYEQRKELIITLCQQLPIRWRIIQYFSKWFITPEQLIIIYNDKPKRQQQQVLKMFARAIKNN